MSLLSAQEFDSKVSEATLQLPNETLPGYSTSFDFGQPVVQKGWWKYAKKFALPQNQRTHYEVTIPGTEDSRAVVIYTQSLGEEKPPTTFKLALKTTDMTEEEKVKFAQQAQALLIDFKRWFYLRHYEEELEKLEKAISKKGRNWNEWMRFIQRREVILEKIKTI